LLRRPSQATAMRVVAEPERRPRMTVLGDVRVELLSGGCEAFVIGLGAEDDGPLRDEQWARLRGSPSARSGAPSRATIRTPSTSLTTQARRGA
jgi:hypothetical protein